MSNDKPISVGSLLAHMRWMKASEKDRAEVGRMLVEARQKKAAKRKKKGAAK